MAETTILLAHAHAFERQALVYILRGEGFTVLEAETAKQVVERSRTPEVELIILDVGFWLGDAIDVPSTLRHHPTTADLPILIFGEAPTDDQRKRAAKASLAGWIATDPFTIAGLIKEIHKTIPDDDKQAVVGKKASEPEPEPDPQSPLTPLTRELVHEVLGQFDQISAFEFSLTDIATASCTKEQLAAMVSDTAGRDPMLAVALLGRFCIAATRDEDKRALSLNRAACGLTSKEVFQLIETLSPLPPSTLTVWEMAHYWVHSLATAQMAALLSDTLQIAKPDEVFTAGLLHDLGYFVLANYLPAHYARLLEHARSCPNPTPAWEKKILGAHHGELGAWVIKRFGLPVALQETTLVHHGGTAGRANVRGSARVMALIVQAADQIAEAVFPGDTILTQLTGLEDDLRSALSHTKIEFSSLIQNARHITAELITEMNALFPGADQHVYFTGREPLQHGVYCAPDTDEFDLIRTFVETRCRTLYSLKQAAMAPPGSPVIVNLTQVPDLARQVETLSSLMAAGLMAERKGAVLLPTRDIPEVHRKMASSNWRLLPTPSQPAQWFPWLAAGSPAPARNPKVAKPDKAAKSGAATKADDTVALA